MLWEGIAVIKEIKKLEEEIIKKECKKIFIEIDIEATIKKIEKLKEKWNIRTIKKKGNKNGEAK